MASVTMSDLLDAIQSQESGGNASAVSWKGARGSFQFMPDTWRQYGSKYGSIHDPTASRLAAKDLVSDLYAKYGDVRQVLGAYNGGGGGAAFIRTHPGAVQDSSAPRDSYRNQTAGYVQSILKKLGFSTNENVTIDDTNISKKEPTLKESFEDFVLGIKTPRDYVPELGTLVLDYGLMALGAVVIAISISAYIQKG